MGKVKKMDFDTGNSVLTANSGVESLPPPPLPPSASKATLPPRQAVPLVIASTAPTRQKPRRLKPDQIVAIVLLLLLLLGIIGVTLALTGVFNRTPPGISLTPSVTIPDRELPPVILVA